MRRLPACLLAALIVAAAPGRGAAISAPSPAPSPVPCDRGTVAVTTGGAVDAALRTGPYSLVFAHGRLLIGRDGARGGLRLTLLPGAGLDLLPRVTGRAVTRDASGVAVTLTARAAWASASITLRAFAACPGLLRWTVHLAPRGAGPADDPTGTDLAYTDAAGRPATPAAVTYTGAEPSAAALTYVYDPDLDSTLFYLADLTALNGLFNASGTGATGGPFRDPRGGPGTLAGAGSGGLGLGLPPGSLTGIAARGAPLTVVDSYLYLGAGRPATETAMAGRFLDALGAIYDLIQKPALTSAGWRALGARAARDLRGPDVLVTLGAHTYLRAYVSDRRAAPELITQLNVLVGLRAYERTFGPTPDTTRLRAVLESDLPTFYAPAYGSVVNNLPLPRGPGATTESWYYIGDLINLARLALDGDGVARALLLRSAPGAVALAHAVRYAFPRTIAYGTWRGGGGLQPDVAGGYAYLMLRLHDLTGDRRYLAEARAGLAHLAGYGFGLAYETHMSALSAAAAARLAVLTGDRRLLDSALLPLANLFASVWLWDCGYGACARGYHTFFGLSPLPWSGYIAMMEQEEAWQAVREYALLAGDRAPAGVRTLVAEFCRYSLATLAYTLPPDLPRGVAAAAPAEYGFVPRNRLDLAIPLEDLREGGQPSGQIGQEIYGAGGPLILGALSALRLAPGLWLTSPYPTSAAPGQSGIRLTLAGTPAYRVALRLDGTGLDQVRIVPLAGGKALTPVRCGAGVCVSVAGGGRYLLSLR